MSTWTDAERDAQDLAKLVNDTGTVTTRYGDNPKRTWQQLQDEFDLTQAGEYVAISVDAASRAETAADSIQLLSDNAPYPDVSAGMSGTLDTNYFSVVSPTPANYLDLYRKNGGVAEFQKSYPSTNFTWGRNNLTNGFMFNGQIPVTTDLNTLRNDGNYYGVAGGNYVNLPPSFTGQFVISVSEAFDGSGSFLIQELRDFNNLLITWVKRLSGGGGGGDWIRTFQSTYMLSKSVLPDGASTRDANEDGVYFLSSANTYLDMPSGTGAKDYLIEVREALLVNKGSFKQQRLSESSNPNKAWVRRVNVNSATAYPWDLETTNDAAVSRQQLSQNYGDKDQLTSGDANTVYADGSYLVTNTSNVLNLPIGVGSGILTVSGCNGNNWGYQEFTELFNGGTSHRRMVRPGNGTVTDWQGMPASGKTIACFGDSLTENSTYPQQLALLLGAKTLRMGFGGCRMANHEDSGYNAMSMCNMAEDIANNDFTRLIAGAIDVRDRTGDDNTQQAELVRDTDWNTVDYVVIFFGTNDYGAHVPLGATTDTTGATFLGGINKTVTNLLTAYPHLKILFITPIWRPRIESGDGKDSDLVPNNNGDFLIEFADAIIERADSYHLESSDFYRKSGFGKLTQPVLLGAGDDIHPSVPVGYKYLTEKVGAAFRSKFGS